MPVGRGALTVQERRLSEPARLRLAARWELARRHPLNFLRWFVFTCDQHDKEEPIKPFPWDRPHVAKMVELWLNNPLLVVAKSRQMLQTWLFCVLYLWDAMFHKGRLIMLQSKREDDAVGDETSGDGLLGRVKFVYKHIPLGQYLAPRAKELTTRLSFPSMNSTLWAIPQGADIIRQRTASGVLSDECAVQPEFADAYVAALPTIAGGGRFTALSTAAPSFFQVLYEDRLEEDR